MGKLGFYCFTSPEVPVPPTLRQQVVALTDEQRQALLTGFEQRIPAAHLDHKLGLAKELIQYVYDGIDTIQEKCKEVMRGETPPATAVALKDLVRPEFLADFPIAFINTTISEMILWCKYDGSGTFSFYKNNIIL